MEEKLDYYLQIGKAADLKNLRERILFRFFEAFPGILAWGTIVLAIFLSWKKPLWVAFFIISYDIFWFFRIIYFSFHLRSSYQKMRERERVDWLEKVKNLDLSSSPLPLENWRDIYHLILLPTYKEPLEILRDTFLALKKSDYPKDRLIIVLSFEERAGRQEREEIAKTIEREFEKDFFKLLITWHPPNLPSEIPGHGSNDTWAAKRAKEEILDPLKIPYQNVIVSFFDVDTVVFPKYFSCLTYHYLTSKNPFLTSFQPIPLYLNNIWQAPALSRIFAFSTTFWHTMNQERPEKLITFSSHAMSFKTLVEVGFKQTNVISDDSRIFWQCFLKYNGDYSVEPLYYPLSMDANVAKNLWQTMKNIYKQQKRWAYGVGDIPYFLFGFLKNKKIPFRKKLSLGFEIIEGHFSWALAPLLIFFLGWLPLVLASSDFSQALISYNLPKITSRILTFSMVGIVFSVYLSLLLLPPKPREYSSLKFLFFVLGWLLVPFVMIFFSSLPALEAQSRWLLGKYLEFWPTEKIRKK